MDRVKVFEAEFGVGNCRDLGGISTFDGRQIRRGTLLRASQYMPTEKLISSSHGLGLVLDLRTGIECSTFPSPFATLAAYRNLPLVPDGRSARAATLEDSYCRILSWYPHQLAAAVTAIAFAPFGGVLVHCQAGKDRTGVVVAVTLSALGVSLADIAADYAKSAECLRSLFETELEHMPTTADRDWWIEARTCRPEQICSALNFLDREFGGAKSYLTRSGVDPRTFAVLEKRLLVDDQGPPAIPFGLTS